MCTLSVELKFAQLTAKNDDGTFVHPDAEKYRKFMSPQITHVDLSEIGMPCPPVDDETSIRQVSERLVVGAVPILSCEGFDFDYVAREMGD